MMPLGLGAWLVSGMLLFAWGFAGAVIGRGVRRGVTSVLAMLGGSVLAAAALTRHQVLAADGLTAAVVILVGGVALLLAGPAASGEDDA